MSARSLLLIGTLLLACGGATPAPPSTSTPASAPATSQPTGAPPAQKVSVESQREPFMNGCLRKVKAPDYCDCAFEQFRQVFKDTDMSQELPEGDARLDELKTRTVAQCSSKLTEEQVKPLFMGGCAGDDPRKASYCTCAWTALRKGLAVADFVLLDDASSRFVEAKKTAARECKGKFPPEIAKSDFMEGCRKGDKTPPKVCECLWKKISAKFTAEEIAAGVADVNAVPGLAECRK